MVFKGQITGRNTKCVSLGKTGVLEPRGGVSAVATTLSSVVDVEYRDVFKIWSKNYKNISFSRPPAAPGPPGGQTNMPNTVGRSPGLRGNMLFWNNTYYVFLLNNI